MRHSRAGGAGRQLCRFALIGVAGFVVDAGVLTLLNAYVMANLYVARLVSFSTAVLATWMCNRVWTFPSNATTPADTLREWFRYVAVQSIGSLTNLAVFFVSIRANPELAQVPVIPLAYGAICGLVVNFLGSRFWVFAVKDSHGAHEANVIRRPLDSP